MDEHFDRRIYLVSNNFSGDSSDPKNKYKDLSLEEYASEIVYRVLSDARTFPRTHNWSFDILKDAKSDSLQIAYRMQALAKKNITNIKTLAQIPESISDWYNTIGRRTQYLVVLSDIITLNRLGCQIYSWRDMKIQQPAFMDENNNFMIDVYKKTAESFPKFSFGKEQSRYLDLFTRKLTD